METTATVRTPIRRTAGEEAILALLEPGDRFRVLELTDRLAWGQAGVDGFVGYVERHALADT